MLETYTEDVGGESVGKRLLLHLLLQQEVGDTDYDLDETLPQVLVISMRWVVALSRSRHERTFVIATSLAMRRYTSSTDSHSLTWVGSTSLAMPALGWKMRDECFSISRKKRSWLAVMGAGRSSGSNSQRRYNSVAAAMMSACFVSVS